MRIQVRLFILKPWLDKIKSFYLTVAQRLTTIHTAANTAIGVSIFISRLAYRTDSEFLWMIKTLLKNLSSDKDSMKRCASKA